MPALKRVALPEGFVAAINSEDRKALNEKKDCAVVAMTVVTGLPYATCHAALLAEGRKPGRGTYANQYTAALEALGFTVREWSYAEMCAMSRSFWDIYRKQVAGTTTHSPRRFPKCFEGKGPLLLRCKGHVAGMDANGVVHDWSINRSLRVHTIVSVTKKG